MPTVEIRDQLQAALGDAYGIERELAAGGMSRLFLATEHSLARRVVIKLLPPACASEASAARFQREITLTAQLQHPHILPILSAGARNGLLYYIMPYVEGESLRQRLEREGRLPVPLAVLILRDVADALARAHAAGVVHRDIKPENILLEHDRAILADFGVARALHEATSADRLTETGTGLGTPGYMAPEQLAGDRNVDARADVYALAVVGYEMLAGVAPFTGPTPQAVAAAHFTSAPRPLAQVRPGAPLVTCSAIGKALSKDPEQRFATAAEFRDALSAVSPVRIAFTNTTRITAAVGVLIAFIAGAALLWLRRGASNHEGPTMLAVLPFENRGDSINAYFADGITDEIRGKLAALPTLRVIATASSNQYRHTTKPLEQISRELGVRYLLTGSVTWTQGANGARRVRISPELVQVAAVPPQTRWRQSFDTTLADVFDVQATVATQVADRLGVILSGPAQTQLAAAPTRNLAAYDAYLRSVALLSPDPATLRQAIAAAEEAVGLDSGFAAAWARVGSLHATLYAASVPTRADSAASAQAVARALALAPKAPEGYEAQGAYDNFVTGDSAAALAAYKNAARLAPNDVDAIMWLATAEEVNGQSDSALLYLRRAKVLDPRSVYVAFHLGDQLLDARQYSEARAEAKRGLSLMPAGLGMTHLLVETYLAEGDLPGAQVVLRNVPPTLDRRALVTFFATYQDLYWVLDSADRELLVTLPASAFDNDRANWAIIRAEVHWLSGDRILARAWADTAREAVQAQLRAGPDDGIRRLILGLALAYLGDRQSAIREGETARTSPALIKSYKTQVLARIYLALGDSSRALDALEHMVTTPYSISPAWLRIDPEFAPLHGNVRFEKLIANAGTRDHL